MAFPSSLKDRAASFCLRKQLKDCAHHTTPACSSRNAKLQSLVEQLLKDFLITGVFNQIPGAQTTNPELT